MNKKKILVAIGFLFLTIYIFSVFLFHKQGDRELAVFISSRIEGKLTYLYAGTGGESFRVNNSKNTYNFVSNMNSLNNYNSFGLVAEIGDSVFKPSFADTLILKKKSGKIYRFTFKKSYR